jgi:hypothetical protein
MSSGKSESSSSTSTSNQDNRVGADNGALALGQGAQLQINEDFPDNVALAFNKLIELAQGAGSIVQDSSKSNQSLTEAAIQALAAQRQVETNSQAFTFNKALPYIVVGAIAVVIVIYSFKKGKK